MARAPSNLERENPAQLITELGDRFEQPRPQRVIEVLARKRLWRASKAFGRLGLQVAYRRMKVDDAYALLSAQWIKCNHRFNHRPVPSGCR